MCMFMFVWWPSPPLVLRWRRWCAGAGSGGRCCCWCLRVSMHAAARSHRNVAEGASKLPFMTCWWYLVNGFDRFSYLKGTCLCFCVSCFCVLGPGSWGRVRVVACAGLWVPLGGLGCPLGTLWVSLGILWRALGALWAPLGGSLGVRALWASLASVWPAKIT